MSKDITGLLKEYIENGVFVSSEELEEILHYIQMLEGQVAMLEFDLSQVSEYREAKDGN